MPRDLILWRSVSLGMCALKVRLISSRERAFSEGELAFKGLLLLFGIMGVTAFLLSLLNICLLDLKLVEKVG